MSTIDFVFAGIDISSGRKPITYGVLDHDLKLVLLERCDIGYVLAHLEQHKKAIVGVNLLSRGKSVTSQSRQKIYDNIRKKIIQVCIQG